MRFTHFRCVSTNLRYCLLQQAASTATCECNVCIRRLGRRRGVFTACPGIQNKKSSPCRLGETNTERLSTHTCRETKSAPELEQRHHPFSPGVVSATAFLDLTLTAPTRCWDCRQSMLRFCYTAQRELSSFIVNLLGQGTDIVTVTQDN